MDVLHQLHQGLDLTQKDFMTRVVQHLKTEAHKEVVSLIKLTEKWNNKDSTHPWIRAHLNSVSPSCLKTLFQMVYTVRND